jgi:hypothetical protein
MSPSLRKAFRRITRDIACFVFDGLYPSANALVDCVVWCAEAALGAMSGGCAWGSPMGRGALLIFWTGGDLTDWRYGVPHFIPPTPIFFDTVRSGLPPPCSRLYLTGWEAAAYCFSVSNSVT